MSSSMGPRRPAWVGRLPDLKAVRRRWPTLVSATVLFAGTVVVVVAAILSRGVPVRQVDLNDGGIWVTSDEAGLFGRLNRPAGSLDAFFAPPGGSQSTYALDVLQNDSAVVAWDRVAGRLFPVDVARGATVGEGLPVPAGFQTRLLGGTLAVLDPATGRIWASRVDTSGALSGLGLDLESEPLAVVEVGTSDDPAAVRASLAVGVDGSVYAASVTGSTATVRPAGAGFGAVSAGELGTSLTQVRVSAVGDRMVVLDPATGSLVVGSTSHPLPGADGGSALQWPGPQQEAVLIATSSALLSVPLDGGAATTLFEEMDGAPTAPMRIGECVYSAWAGATGGYARGCGGTPVSARALEDAQVLVDPMFRANRGAVVLNDLRTGGTWDLLDEQRVDNWSLVQPPPVIDPSTPPDPNPDIEDLRDQPPRAVADELGARPGRTTLLHVLDNDSDPAGSILSIVEVTEPDVASATLAIAPDGQTVAITVAGSGEPVHFTYTIDDGRKQATADVTVRVRAPGENEQPELWVGYDDPGWTVTSGGRLAMPVLADWRDFDGDPIALAGASVGPGGGTVAARTDGFLEYLAPVVGGVHTITYDVADGVGEPTQASVDVTVLAADATTTSAPQTRPDVARGQVGQPIVVLPLDNDIPGADPASPAARLALAGDVNSVADAVVVTNLATGTVVVTAARPGTYELTYTAAYGNAAFAEGKIRVDVTPAPDSPDPPVAMPDTVVLRGQLPSTVDVLANDFDPAGGVLAVVHAEPADPAAQLQVAVVEGHWLRINALDAAVGTVPQVVRYSISNGTNAAVTGEVSVTRLPEPADTTPVPVDDIATVRSGGTVTVAVLDNDTNAGGAPMTLAGNVLGAPAPGQLTVTAPGTEEPGTAYVTGNLVRYVAPEVSTAQQATVDYVVRNAAGDQAVGHLKVTVVPPPSDENPNRPPAPAPVEARAVSGQTVTITIPTTGVDVDGDPVTVAGIASAPARGRIVAMNATSIAYQAFPTSAGTDSFTYLVMDQFGGVGRAGVRVGITPPGSPQPPVAVDDVVTAAPGAVLHIDVLANDLVTPGDVVSIQPLEDRNPQLPAGTSLVSAVGPLDTVGTDPQQPVVILYAITNGIGQPSVGRVTVRGQDGYNNAPIAYDAYADPEPGATTVAVDVLARCADPDGDIDDLEITRVFDPGATIEDGTVTLLVSDTPRTVSYEVRDAGGATAVGLIHVSVPGAGMPYLRPGASIEIGQNAAANIDITEYVVSPSGRPLRLTTTDRIWAAPPQGLLAATSGETGVDLTAIGDYIGPAALIIEVTDGETLSDPLGRTAIVSIPVQVGPETPVLHCPLEPIGVVEGGPVVTVDLTTVCHVWVADPEDLADLTYSASWQQQANGIELGAGGRSVTLSAASGTVPGTTGSVEIGVPETRAVPDTLRVEVLPAAPAAFTPVVVDGIHAAETRTVDLTGYVRSVLREPRLSVIRVEQTAGMEADVSFEGSTVTLTPGEDAHGEIVFDVTVTDVADESRVDRHVTGQITLSVWGHPDAPGTPTSGSEILSHQVELLWGIPANNGAEIRYYDVSWSSSAGGDQQRCPAPPCMIGGLQNNVPYVFTVVAHNVVGDSDPSPSSGPITPDAVPTAVTGLVASNPQDGTLTLNWQPAQVDGSPVQRYNISWGNGGTGTSTSTTFRPAGLDNEVRYTFTVVAVNNAGPGPGTAVTSQSAGAPARPAAPSFSSLNSVDSSSRAVTVSWAPVSPNGPGPTTYTLVRTGNGTVTICADVTVTSCPDDGIPNNGTVYTYTVTAENGAAASGPNHTSQPSPGTTMEATATPDPITTYSIAATGTDGQAQLTFDVPPSHGASSTVNCSFSGSSCGSWSYPVGGQTGVVRTINGLPDGVSTAVSLQVCNGSSGGFGAGTPCNTAVSRNVTTYGNMQNLNISITSVSGPNVTYTVSVDPNGKPATVRVQSNVRDVTFTTGNGAGSWQYTDNVGYSTTDNISVTVTDAPRPQLTASASATTGPQPTVTVTPGSACGPSTGTTCPGGNAGCSATCWRIVVQTANFPGNVTCSFDSSLGSGGWPDLTFGANETRETTYWYGVPSGWVTVTCNGVSGTRSPWI